MFKMGNFKLSLRTVLIGCCVYVGLLTFIIMSVFHRSTHQFIKGHFPLQWTSVVFNGFNIAQLETVLDKRHLTSREACSLESVARRHPFSQLTLYTVNDGYHVDDRYIRTLTTNYDNIRFHPLNLSDVFSMTPLSVWWSEGRIGRSLFPATHLSDALRLAILYKFGGVYLDTDVIAVRPLNAFTNTVSLESESVVSNCVMFFDRYSPFVHRCMVAFVRRYSWTSQTANGRWLLTRVARETCNVSHSFKDVVDRPSSCDGLRVVPAYTFDPVVATPARTFKVDGFDFWKNSYAVHLWAMQFNDGLTKMDGGDPIRRLFNHSCPITYQLIED